MVDEGDGHAACVGAWLEGASEGLPAGRLIDLLERACDALWSRVRPTLSDVTLGAIFERVVHATSERFPAFASLEVGPSGLLFGGLRARAEGLRKEELVPALRFLLVEFLTVLGHLTAEVLTPALHTALGAVALEAPAGAARSKTKAPPAGGRKRKKS
jgi:hypothetical protein